MSCADDAIEALRRDGLVSRTADPAAAEAQQKRALQSLLRSAEQSSRRSAYLNHYDALLRMVELVLLSRGYCLGQQPHLATRKLVAALCGETSLPSVIAMRHDVKKAGVEPKADDLEKLLSIRAGFAERAGLSHLLGDRWVAGIDR